jgi:thiol-disulfide isomerase/thioredoxin
MPDELRREQEVRLVIVVVAAETVLLAIVAVFVVALLRSHAEILRRLEQLSPQSPVPRPEEAAVGARKAPELEGATLDGGARRVALGHGPDTLVAFLSSGCTTCLRLLDTLAEAKAELPPGLRLVVVAKDRKVERLRLLRQLDGRVDLLFSSAAWESYDVPGSPYFVHVDGASGVVTGEGSAPEWRQVASLIVDAGDDPAPDVANRDRIDDALAAAGIGPGHPSLHPATREENGG